MSHYDCLDGPQGCQGPVSESPSLSGSGMTFPRCATHYDSYVARVQPRLDQVRRRYPVHAPADFDPLACGERWDEED